MRLIDRILPIVVVCLMAARGVYAQESIHYATLSGRVTDPSGAVVPKASVAAKEVATNVASKAETDSDGRFHCVYLRSGDYELTIHRDGFADATRHLTLTVGSDYEVAVELKLASASSVDRVSDIADALETARTQIASTVEQSEIRSLPLNGRSFLDLALLVPGVSPTNTASTQLFPETSGVPGQGISAGSQRNFSNNFIVDGLSANDDAAGLSGLFYGLDTVQELQVVTSGGQAELGRALGGYVNLVTKSGTNQLHGSLYGYFRNQRFNARNALSAVKLPLTQAQAGASLGGAIVRDRTFFFGNFEGRDLNQSGLITIAPANVTAINNRLTSTGYQGSLISTGLYPNPVHNTGFTGKIDQRFGENDLFTVRYSMYDVHSQNSRGVGALSAVSAAAGLDNTDQTVAASNVWTLSPRLANETRGQFTHSDLAAEPNDTIGPAVSISGIAAFGRLSGSPTGRANNLYEIVDTVSYLTGAHAWRAGIDYLYNDDTITFPRSNRGSYSFSSLANFLSGTYNSSGYTQTFGNSAVSQTNPNLGLFLQDEWKAARHLTFNLGLRYDLQFLQTIATETNNVSPRLGFAWSPGSGWVVRGGFGLFYDRIPLRAVANALLSSGNTTLITPTTQASVSLSPTQAGAPIFPNILSGTLPPGILFNFSTMNPNMRHAYSDQANVEVQRQVGRNGSLSVGYQHLRGLHLIVSINQNVPTCAAAGTNNGCRPNSTYANNSQYSPRADSRYDGLHVSYVQRPVKWGEVRMSYTWSHALDDVGEFFFSAPIDNSNVWRDYGRSDDDQRHRFVLHGTARAPLGLNFGAMLQYYSALPFNVTTGANTIQGTGGRPIVNGDYIGRNVGIGPDFFNLNLRVSRTFHITERFQAEAIAESFNTLNHVNPVTLNGTFGTGAYPTTPSATFGQVTAVSDPRSLQFALRLSF